ncbi:hypothetical protein CALVIDRAFT_471354, partial [Calocera viscosa TUFC12733]
LKTELDWSIRVGTKAAHKLPFNWEQQCKELILRVAWEVNAFQIPAACIVNSDQMQCHLQHGTQCTYAKTGSRQVSINGKEEKRAFTVMTSLSMHGTLLPFQNIWDGTTDRSLPFGNRLSKPIMATAREAGHLFSTAGDTYWSTLDTMKTFVERLLVPYFQSANLQADRSPLAYCIWIIDCWSVHRSADFRAYMQDEWPWILLQFIPAGCTGVIQPADAGMQRPLKAAIRRSATEQVIAEIRSQLEGGTTPEDVHLNTKKGILRDRTVSWLLHAHEQMNKPERV